MGDNEEIVKKVWEAFDAREFRKAVPATSFFEIEDDRIIKMTEYWSEPYDAPKWRSKWVKKVED